MSQVSDELSIHAFSSYLWPTLAQFGLPTTLEGFVTSWDPIFDRNSSSEAPLAELAFIIGAQTSLRLLDLTNPGSGRAFISAPRYLATIWTGRRPAPSTLVELRLDCSVSEDEASAVIPLLQAIPSGLLRLKILHLGTLSLRSHSSRQAFFAALAGVTHQLEALTLTRVEAWLKTDPEATHLGILLAPISCLTLLPYNPQADLTHLRTAPGRAQRHLATARLLLRAAARSVQKK